MSFAGVLTAAMERGGLRGAPTLFGYLSRIPLLEKQVATVTLPTGQRISFPAYDPYWCRYLYAGKPYEPDVERIFMQLRNGRVLVDCGANIGYWSVRHRDFGFTSAIAIEPNPKLTPFLRMNHSGQIIEKAVDSQSGRTVRFAGDGAVGHVSRKAEGGIPVPTIALRDIEIGGPALVKIDVEGKEIDAIEGLGDLDCIVVYEDFPRQGMKVTRYLLDKGWKLFTDRLEPITAVEQVSADLGKGGHLNLVAMRQTAARSGGS
jgi:FkbM family methyltransferase